MSCSTISTGTLRGDVLHQVGDALAFRRREPGERLVEQQHLRLGAERDAEIDQPLAAIGKVAAFGLLDPFEPEEADQLGGLGVNLRIAVDVAPDIEARRDAAPAATGAGSRRSTELRNRLVIWNERAMPCRQMLVRRQAVDIAAVQPHGAAVRREQAGHEVEQGGLAGAVRPDQRMDLAGADRQARVRHGADAAELLGDAVDLERRSRRPSRARRKAGSGRPS